jgi:ketosteroid isomerase-like protein
MGEAASIDLIRMERGYKAIARQDWDEVTALYDPEIEWIDPPEVPDGGTHVGIEAVKRSWQNYLEALEDWTLQPQEVLLGEDDIFVRSHMTGKARIGGIPLDMDLFQVWTARDGKLIRHRGFLDRQKALDAAGLKPD